MKIAALKVSSKGQIVISGEIRKNMKIKEGTILVLLEKEDNFMEEFSEFEEKKLWFNVGIKSLLKDWDNPEDNKY